MENHFSKALKIGSTSTFMFMVIFLVLFLLFLYTFEISFYWMFLGFFICLMFYFYYLVENREAIKRWYINTKGRQDASCLLDGIDPASAIYLNKNRGKLTEVMFKEFLNDSKS